MKENFQDTSNELVKVLQTYWERFLFTLPRLVLAVIIITVAIFIASHIQRLLSNRLSGKTHDPLFIEFISKLTKIALIICGIIIALQALGLSGIAGGLLAGAGISAFIFGFAFKDIAENFLAGIILAFNRPFSMNDTIKVNDYFGHIIALNFRTTHIKTFDEKDVFIPNAIVVKETLTNFTRDGLIRLDFVVGIAYEDDIKGAIEVIKNEMKQVESVELEKEPFVVVEELATSTVNLRAYFWTTTDDYKKGVLITKSEVIRRVKEGLTNKGFTLPADIQELKLYDKRDYIPIKVMSNE